jgi:hypothetical protein
MPIHRRGDSHCLQLCTSRGGRVELWKKTNSLELVFRSILLFGLPPPLALSFPSRDSVFLSILFAWGSRFLISSCSCFASTPGASILRTLGSFSLSLFGLRFFVPIELFFATNVKLPTASYLRAPCIAMKDVSHGCGKERYYMVMRTEEANMSFAGANV